MCHALALRRHRALQWVLLAVCLTNLQASDEQEVPPEEPADVGLTEVTGRSLIQLDVTVSGPNEVITSLTAEDFVVKIGGRSIEQFQLDRVCQDPFTLASQESARSTVTPLTFPTTYVFYFEQASLSMRGRQRAYELAKELIPTLVAGDNQGMVVSSARNLRTFADLTDNVDELVAAVGRVQEDPEQWDPIMAMADRGTNTKFRRKFMIWVMEKSFARLAMLLAGLVNVDPPKAVIYFADQVGPSFDRDLYPTTVWLGADSYGYSSYGRGGANIREQQQHSAEVTRVIEHLVDDTNAQGVRLYNIHALGASPGSITNPRLKTMTRATGGDAYLDVASKMIAKRIQAAFSCFYLVSFDRPEGLEEDTVHLVDLEIRPRKVKHTVRQSLVVQSESSRLTSQLLGAFASPRALKSHVGVGSHVIPVGYADGEYSGLVQAAVAGSPLRNATWDMGISLISHGKVREQASGRVTVDQPNTPVVFETLMQFRPGPFELVMVAHEINVGRSSGIIATGQFEGEWPDPTGGEASVGPIAVLQEVRAAFLRDGETRVSGPLGRAVWQPVRTDLPLALMTLVCRGSVKGPLQVVRRLVGQSAVGFPVKELTPGQGPCVSFLDEVPADTMTEGRFNYEVRVLKKKREVVVRQREFVAIDPHASRTPG